MDGDAGRREIGTPRTSERGRKSCQAGLWDEGRGRWMKREANTWNYECVMDGCRGEDRR